MIELETYIANLGKLSPVEQETVFFGMVAFTGIILILVTVILIIRSKLIASGQVKIMINDDSELSIQVPVGGKLLSVLASQAIYLPSACGGKGTCGQCRVIVTNGGGKALPTEQDQLSHYQLRAHYRLACQLVVKEDLALKLPAGLMKTSKWNCVVRSNRCVATFIKELILDLPPDTQINFRAGGYILLEAPSHNIAYRDFGIEARYRPTWDKFNLWQYTSTLDKSTSSAYSMANYPGEKGMIMLNVRIASPPPSHPEVPPGKVSSYIYSLKPGDNVQIAGPFGEFFARETENEMIFVGGGSGMAPKAQNFFLVWCEKLG
jgi:Na+-transporting NADH:ubiquinone oxidoreductase subunit F